jgi:hypothetical protein
MGISRQRHQDVPRLRPGEDDQGLTRHCAARRLCSAVSIGEPIRGAGPLGGCSGRIGRFKGAGSLLGQAGGHSEHSRRVVRMAFVTPRDSLDETETFVQPMSLRDAHANEGAEQAVDIFPERLVRRDDKLSQRKARTPP